MATVDCRPLTMKLKNIIDMKKAIRIFVFVLLGAVVIGTFVYLYQKSRPEVKEYQIVKPIVQTLSKKTIATGKIEPRNEVEIKPQISGIISEIYKEAGEVVREGDVIALIKVIPEMGTLNSAESRVNIAKIDFEQAKIDYDRADKLFEKKVLSAEEFEKERVAYNKAKEEYQNAVDNLEIIRDGIAKSSGGYSNTQIRATISGLILDVPVKIGNSVIQSNNFNDGTTICTIADMGDMIFKGSIDESEVGRIREGLPIVLTIGALQDMKFDAVLEYVSPKGVEESGAVMFEIKAAAKIPDSVMVRAGYSANAEIILMQRNNVLAIPEGVVEMVGDSAFVYQLDTTVTNEQKFNRVPVTIGMSDGLNIELIDGVEPNARLRGNLK